MKKLVIILTLLAGGLLQSCQCSDKPDIGPVQPQNQASSAGEVYN